MLSSFFAATVRHRRIILVVEAVLAVLYVIVQVTTRALGWFAYPSLLAFALVLLGLFLATYKRHRPAVLTVRPERPSFDTPVSPFTVYFFTGFAGIWMVNVTSIVRNISEREELWQLDAAILVLYVVAAAIWFRAGWGHVGVRLRPDGVIDHNAVGSLFVPWEAFDRAYPAWPAEKGDRLLVNYEGRARRRGVVMTGRRVMTGYNVDRWFLARTIQHYVVHPEDRASIGTDAGYARLTQALTAPAEQQV